MTTDFEFTGFNLHHKQLAWIRQRADQLKVSQSEALRRVIWEAMQARAPRWDNALSEELAAWKPEARETVTQIIRSFRARL